MGFLSNYKLIAKLPFIFFIFILIPFNPFNFKKVSSSSLNNHIIDNSLSSNIKKFKNDEIINTPYLIGPGDILSILFTGIDEFSRLYTVDNEGYIFLPEIFKYKVDGLSIKEIEIDLSNKYEKYLIDPNINIILNKPRPIIIHIGGEVKKPGIYNLDYEFRAPNKNRNTEFEEFNYQVNAIPIVKQPRLFDALKEAKGFSHNADLSNIQVVRNNAQSLGGGKILTTLNLFSLINDGDQSQNIRIFDGDSIFIKKTNFPAAKQFLTINKSNINPEFIRIYVSGNVNDPGSFDLPRGSSLFEAISAAGGETNFSGKIRFIRFNEYGETTSRYLSFDPAAVKGSKNNPILNEGDLIDVKKSNLRKLTTIINEVGSPIINAYGIFSLFE